MLEGLGLVRGLGWGICGSEFWDWVYMVQGVGSASCEVNS